MALITADMKVRSRVAARFGSIEGTDTMTRSQAVIGKRKLRLMGTQASHGSYALRDFLHRSAVPFEWIELTTDEQARELAQVENLQDSRLPVCIFPDGTRQDCPTIRQITEKLGWFRKRLRAPNTISPFSARGLPASAPRSTAHPRDLEPY